MSEEIEELELPEFLIISPEDRLRAWNGVKVTHPAFAAKKEEWRDAETKRKWAELQKRREKNAKGLAKIKAEHPGQRYNQRLKRWVDVKVTAPVTENENA